MSPKGSQKPWRLETVGARCIVGGILGIIAGTVATVWVSWQAAILVGWDVASLCFLVWTWLKVGGLDAGDRAPREY